MERPENVHEFKAEYERRHPGDHFFDHETLKFFGETMSSMRLLKCKARVKELCGEEHTCFVLSTSQRIPFVGRRRKYHYFDCETLDNIIPE